MNQNSRNENKFFNNFIEGIKTRFDSIIYGLETTKHNYKSIKDDLINFRDIEGEERYQRKLDNYSNKLSKFTYGSDTELDLTKIDYILKNNNIDLDTVLKWGDESPVGYNINKWIKGDNYVPLYDLLSLKKPELDMIFIESDNVSTNRKIDHASKENVDVYPFLNDYPTYDEINTIRHFFEKAIKDFYVIQLKKYIKVNVIKPNSKKKEKKKKTLIEYFKDHPDFDLTKLAEIFNKNESPKEYAMMLCILTQKGFITINSKGRKDFYKAWYDFINKQYPESGSFSAINDYIGDKSKKGFQYEDEYDPDYLSLIEKFEVEFIPS